LNWQSFLRRKHQRHVTVTIVLDLAILRDASQIEMMLIAKAIKKVMSLFADKIRQYTRAFMKVCIIVIALHHSGP